MYGMNYEFRVKMENLAKVVGISVIILTEQGKIRANFSDGTKMSMPSGGGKVTIMWGSGHTALATLAAM